MNVAVVAAAATVTDAGIVSAAALSDSVTLAPPVFDSVTVHVLEAPEANEVGAQTSPVSVGGTTAVTPPPDPETVSASPAADAASALVTPMLVVVTDAAKVTVTVATTPF